MKDLIRFVATGLGAEESSLAFEESNGEGEQRLTAKAPYAVVQKLDGRDHRTAKALRAVLSASAAAKNTRFVFTAEAQD